MSNEVFFMMRFFAMISLVMLLLTSPVWAAQTLLLTSATVSGSASQPGDTFQVHVTVTNVGPVTAVNTRGDLRNAPPSWIITPPTNSHGPTNGSHVFGDILPGQTANITYTVTRDANEPYPIPRLFSRVFADNAPVAESNGIEVPIHPLVGGLLVATMAGGAFLISRKK